MRHVAAFAAVSVLLCVMVMGAARYLPGVDSWADLGIGGSVPLRWWVAVLLSAAATIGAVAVHKIAHVAGDALAVPTQIPSLSVPDTSEISADIVRSIHTAISEELLLFAVPIALGALAWRKVTGNRYLPLRVERTGIVVATIVVVVGLRVVGHLYWGFPAVLLVVVPWMLGTWLIFCLAGSIWPLIVGHVIYDIFVFAMARSPDTHWLTTGFAITVWAGICVILAAPTLLTRLPPSQMWRIEHPRRIPSVSAVSAERGPVPGAP